jgi:hypothetical protein
MHALRLADGVLGLEGRALGASLVARRLERLVPRRRLLPPRGRLCLELIQLRERPLELVVEQPTLRLRDGVQLAQLGAGLFGGGLLGLQRAAQRLGLVRAMAPKPAEVFTNGSDSSRSRARLLSQMAFMVPLAYPRPFRSGA